MKVRVTDIARVAGVSTATVDRVLNRRKGVNDRTSERVRQALAKLQELQSDALEGRLPKRAESKTFDFLIPTRANFFLDTMAKEVEQQREEFALLGIEPRAHRMEGFNPVHIAAKIREIAKKSDGICLVAIDHPLVREAINTTVAAGVPIVTLVTDIPSSRRIGYVGVDNFTAGRLAGYLMGRFLGSRKGSVALIAGNLTYRGHADRELGFRRVLREDFPNLRILDVREAQDEIELTFSQAADLLSSHANLLGIYNIGGGSQGVARALIEAKRQDVVLIAHELKMVTRELLVNGVIDAVLNQDPVREVAGAIRMLINHHAGREITANVEPVRIEVFFRENLPPQL